MIKEVSFSKTYKVSGDPKDAYFAQLPANDLGGLSTFLRTRQKQFAKARILDIGANIGLAALLMHDILPEAHVHSFEPSRISFAYLEANLKQNGVLGRNVSAHQMAIGAETKTEKFTEMPGNHSGSRMEDKPGSYDVKQMSIDNFVRQHDLGPVGFIKLDVEGYEIAALKGASHVIKHHNPVFLFECNPMALRMSGISLSGFLANATTHLNSALFSVEYEGPASPLPSSPEDAARFLESLMTNDHHVFDLVNRLD